MDLMKRYGIDLYKLAAEFAARSPDLAMKEAIRSLKSGEEG